MISKSGVAGVLVRLLMDKQLRRTCCSIETPTPSHRRCLIHQSALCYSAGAEASSSLCAPLQPIMCYAMRYAGSSSKQQDACPDNRMLSLQRVVPLQGGLNFRDLGGYETLDGCRVRWRTVFRSGVMSYLTLSDAGYLQQIGIRVLCDFRTRDEREREAVRWPGAEVVRLEWDYDPRQVSLRGLRSESDFSPEITRSAIIEFYRTLPAHFEEQYAGLFAKLAAGDVPLVFGCSAGKDRTGVAAALVLTCLGVPWEEVVKDFALTDQVVDLEQAIFQHSTGSLGLSEDQSRLRQMSPEARAPLLRASPEYLEAAFDQIRRDHGSIDAYLHGRLRVTPERAASIRAHLLET